MRTLEETQPAYQHVTETHQIRVSQPPENTAQRDLVSDLLSSYKPLHRSEQLQENNVTIVHQPVISKQSTGFGASNHETTLPITEN